MRVVLQDLRYGARVLTRTPGFAALAVTVLALGIGVNVTVFTLANAFFLRPLPVSDPDTVVRVYMNRFSNTPQRTYLELQQGNATLDALAGFQMQSFGLGVDGDNAHVFGELVTGNYFQVLGIRAQRGRLLEPSDDRPDAPGAVVLSHGFWLRQFGGASDVVGRTVALNGVRFTIVGIAGPEFTGVLGPLAGDLWVPLSADAVLRPSVTAENRREFSLHLIGRLKPGVTRAQAQADFDAIGQRLRAARGISDRGPAVSVYGSTMLPPELSTPVSAFTAVLMVVVALVLLIVCVNVANLVLARAAGRTMEFAVRQSLGAGRRRLIYQLLTENLMLSLAGAAGGLGLAFVWARFVAAARLPVPVPLFLDLSVDMRVVAFTIGASVATTVAFGVAPALVASQPDLVTVLKGGISGSRRHSRLRSAFLVAQVAMSVLLLVVAGLAVRSVRYAQAVDRGFETTGVLTASVNLETRGYSEAGGRAFARSLVERLQASPGVVNANVVDIIPLTLSNTTGNFLRDGDVQPSSGQPWPTPQIYMNSVGPGHFATLDIDIVAGRDFTQRDDESAAAVAIVNETMARRFWPGNDPLGKRLRASDDDPRIIEVVGIARDSKYVTVGEDPRPFMYRPIAQAYVPQMTMLVRATGTTASTLATIKQAVRELDPGLAVFNVATLADATDISLLPARVAGGLLGVLGVFALMLAALGIYGVLSFLVRSRTREIGVRVAVGAPPREVATMVVRQAMTWCVAGALIGLALALTLTRFLRVFLYGVSTTDPLTFGVVLLLLGAVACLAAVVPAVRASRVDPVIALRNL